MVGSSSGCWRGRLRRRAADLRNCGLIVSMPVNMVIAPLPLAGRSSVHQRPISYKSCLWHRLERLRRAQQGRSLCQDNVGRHRGEVLTKTALLVEPLAERRPGAKLAQPGHDTAADVIPAAGA